MTTAIAPTDFQSKVLAFRNHAAIMDAGGRGSGKSFCMILDLISHCADFGDIARPLVLREQWAALQELSDKILSLCIVVFGPKVQRNKGEGIITLPNGAIITLSNIGDEESYAKLQGKTFTALYADECGNFSPMQFRLMQRVRSNLRVPPGRRAHIHMTANPHGRSHSLVYKGFVSKSAPFAPFVDEFGEPWVWCHSDLRANPHIDRQAYERQLRAACGGDEALAKAWIDGDWATLGGVMFDIFDPTVHLIQGPPPGVDLYNIVGADFGTASPSTAILLGRLLNSNGRYRAGDIVALDECDTAIPNDLSSGTGASVSSWAEIISEMLARNGVGERTQVVTDDQRGLSGDTVVREMNFCGLNARRPNRKNRVASWTLIRSMLQSAVEKEDRPALWVSSRCPHLVETLAEAPRGTLRPEDICPKYDRDHWLDGLSYGVTALHFERSGSGRVIGLTH